MPFKSLHNKSAFKGSGMGLFICEKIMSKYKGTISVKSQVDEGTTFILSFSKF
jgi:signal transduction histidine kinase